MPTFRTGGVSTQQEVRASMESDLLRIDRLARSLENSQGTVHGRKGKAVSLKSTEQYIDTGSMHAALKQAFASPGIRAAISMPFP